LRSDDQLQQFQNLMIHEVEIITKTWNETQFPFWLLNKKNMILIKCEELIDYHLRYSNARIIYEFLHINGSYDNISRVDCAFERSEKHRIHRHLVLNLTKLYNESLPNLHEQLWNHLQYELCCGRE
jgi:hypothetical protein